MIIAPR